MIRGDKEGKEERKEWSRMEKWDHRWKLSKSVSQ